jgi:hypothetical protein
MQCGISHFICLKYIKLRFIKPFVFKVLLAGFMKKSLLLLTFCTSIFFSCKDTICGCAPPLITRLHGQWEWIKTETPSQTITPQQTENSQEMNFSNDSMGYYVTYYHADSLLSKWLFGLSGHQENEKENTIIVRFNPNGYMKFILKGDKMETSGFMNAYSSKSDTVRHYYQYKGEARK